MEDTTFLNIVFVSYDYIQQFDTIEYLFAEHALLTILHIFSILLIDPALLTILKKFSTLIAYYILLTVLNSSLKAKLETKWLSFQLD